MKEFDVAVIGAGVTGCAIARELTRYRLSVLVIEACEDICSGTSKANSAIIHAGYDAVPGTMKAKMNVRGSEMMPRLARDLDFSFRRNGSLVLCFAPEDVPKLEELRSRGVRNGVKDLRVIGREELLKLEKNISDDAFAALYAPTGGIVCPFEMTAAFAENACRNGAEFLFQSEVSRIERSGDGFIISCGGGSVRCRRAVNAAGVYADRLHAMVSAVPMKISPCRGSYMLLDKTAGAHVSRTIFQLPDEKGKGVLVTPTVHGNLLIGPTAVMTDGDREDTGTTAEELDAVRGKSLKSVRDIPYRSVITSFAGLRAKEAGGDFILGECPDCRGFYEAAGIESPGLSSAPAIGEYLAKMIAEDLKAKEKQDFDPYRRGIPRLSALPPEERARLIAERPSYGRIVCRCEQISEGEIIDAIRRKPGAVSMDGVKRRVRAGMGRCQAGFCTARVMSILARELGVDESEVRKNMPGSELLL